jgi:hypothetical protein
MRGLSAAGDAAHRSAEWFKKFGASTHVPSADALIGKARALLKRVKGCWLRNRAINRSADAGRDRAARSPRRSPDASSRRRLARGLVTAVSLPGGLRCNRAD